MPQREDDDFEEDDPPPRPRKKKKKRPKPKEPNTVAIIVVVFFGIVALCAAGYGVKRLMAPKAPAVAVDKGQPAAADKGQPAATDRGKVADAKWKEIAVGSRFKISLPGPAEIGTQTLGPVMQLRTYQVKLDEDSLYGAFLVEGGLPPERAKLPAEKLLNDSCDGSVAGARANEPSVVEVSRTSVQFGKYPGKQLVLDVPAKKGRLVSRVYLIDGQLLMLQAGGKGLTEDHPDIKRFFDSLKANSD